MSSYSLKLHSLQMKPMMHAWKIHLLFELIMIVKSMWTSMQEIERLLSGNRESQWPDQTCLTCAHNVLILGSDFTNTSFSISVWWAFIKTVRNSSLFIMVICHGSQCQLCCREKSGICTTSWKCSLKENTCCQFFKSFIIQRRSVIQTVAKSSKYFFV